MAAPEALHALHERLLGAGGEEDHAHAAHGLLAERVRQGHDRPHGAEVVVGARAPRRGCRCRPSPPWPRRRRACRGAGGPRRPERPPERREHRAEEHAEHDREALVRLLVQPRREAHTEPRQRRVEDESAVGGVVVGDEHERALGIAVPGLGHHIPGGAVGQRRTAEPQPPAARVVPHRRGGERAHQRRERAAPGERGQQAGGVQEPDRPPVAAVGGLGLDPGLTSGGAQLARPPSPRPGAPPAMPTGARTRRARGPPARSGRGA